MKTSKRIVIGMGRFSPPTIGHQRLVEEILHQAEQYNCAHMVIVSKTRDFEDDPLDPATKFSYLKKIWPNVQLELATEKHPTIAHFLADLGMVFDEVVIVCGEDRVNTFTAMMIRANESHFRFKEWKIISCGKRDNSGVIESISGTKMREAARDGDLRTFIKGLPTTCTAMLGLLMFEDIRAAINMDEILGEKSIAKKETTKG